MNHRSRWGRASLGAHVDFWSETDAVKTKEEETLPAKAWPRVLKASAALLAVAAGVWALFSFVITDRELFLEYVRVLAWPMLVAVALYWLRDPLRDKLRQLLRIEVPGGAAQFANSGDELARQLKPDVDSLLGEGASGEQRVDAHGDDAMADRSAEADEGEDASAAAEPARDEGHTEGVTVEQPQGTARGEGDAEEAEAAPPAPAALEPRLAVSPYRVVQLAKAVGLGPKATQRVVLTLEEDPDTALRQIEAGARNAAVHRSQESRDSIERIIRKSATWGFDMGVAGAPSAEPEVEWNSDGSWRIATEVPPSTKSEAVAKAVQMSASQTRSIKELEDEIKKLERERLSPFGSGISRMNSEPWLRELKSRLSLVDPGNPWSV